MQLNLEAGSDGKLIRHYELGRIQVNEQWYEQSVIITAQEVQLWPVQSMEQLDARCLQPLISLQPDIIILGTGDKQQFLASELMSLIWQSNIGCEVMNSNAACRTYNVLMSEDRAVVAGIIVS